MFGAWNVRVTKKNAECSETRTVITVWLVWNLARDCPKNKKSHLKKDNPRDANASCDPASNSPTHPRPITASSSWLHLPFAWPETHATSHRAAVPGSAAVIKLIDDPANPKQTRPSCRSFATFRRVRVPPQMSLIPREPEKTRHRAREGEKSCRGMWAGRARALISHVCRCQTKCLCCWEVFPC